MGQILQCLGVIHQAAVKHGDVIRRIHCGKQGIMRICLVKIPWHWLYPFG